MNYSVIVCTLFSLAVTLASASLTKDNLESTAGDRAVFIKFFAPWCGHCKAMAPAWQTLMDDFQDSTSVLVTECDCTAGCKDLCSSVGVQGYPTIKYGDPQMLEDYKGARDLDSLKKHAENIKMSCSPKHKDNCDEGELEQLNDLMQKSKSELVDLVAEQEGVITTVEEEFKTAVSSLQETYTNLLKTKDEKIAQVNQSGLRLMKAVLAEKS